MKIFIFSGNAGEARELAKRLNLHPKDFVYISKAETLKGARSGLYIKTGTFYEHRYYSEICLEIKIQGFIELSVVYS